MGNNMFSMGDCFSSENARKELIKQLKDLNKAYFNVR